MAADRQLVFDAPTPMGLLLHHAQTQTVPPSGGPSADPGRADRLYVVLAKDRAFGRQSAREWPAACGDYERRLTRRWRGVVDDHSPARSDERRVWI